MGGSRVSWKRVDGVLLLDKAEGISSNTALQQARRLYSAKKAGHTGTLDPLATGLLPLCFGEATKFSSGLLDADKTYEAELLFGIKTDTGDREGAVIESREPRFSLAELETALAAFRGEIRQIPPMYSALKHEGKPLYRLARQGVEIKREARAVTIHKLQLIDFYGKNCKLRVVCSKGTYIRTLAEDIGDFLECGAHLSALRRTAVGALTLEDALTLETLNALTETERVEKLKPTDALLQNLPILSLDENSAKYFLHGNPIATAQNPDVVSGQCRVYVDKLFIGLGECEPDGTLKPRRLLAD